MGTAYLGNSWRAAIPPRPASSVRFCRDLFSVSPSYPRPLFLGAAQVITLYQHPSPASRNALAPRS